MKTKKEIALEFYENHYNIESVSKFLKVPISTINKWVADEKGKVIKKTAKTTYLTDIKHQFVKDIPSIIKALTLLGYEKEQVAMVLNIEVKELDDLIENVDEILDAYRQARHIVHGKVVEALLGAIMPGKKVERHYYIDYPKDKDGNITDISQATEYLGKIIEKEDRGDVAGLIRWLEVNAPNLWNIKDKALADKMSSYGVADVGGDESEENWEDKATEHQTDLKNKVRTEIAKAEDEE